MIGVAAVVIVAGAGFVYILLRVLNVGKAQRNFCMITTMIALCLGVLFGENATAAAIAIMIFGMGGLLAIDKRARGVKPLQRPSQVGSQARTSDEVRSG